MQKGVIVLVLCFALLLGIVLMDPQLTGLSLQNITSSDLYEGNNLTVAFSVIALIFVLIGLTYHQLHGHLPQQKR